MMRFNLVKNLIKKKNFYLCFGFLALVFFLFLPSPTLAWDPWESLKNAVLFVPYTLIALIIILFILISWGFAWLCGAILDIVISPSFVSLSYTNPANNPIIASGLTVTQSLVNLILVGALIYTALSIALRINETEAKKILVRLIVVALLANFAPVLCGLIVDAANIAMYHFLKPIEEGVSGFLLQFEPFVNMVKDTIWESKAEIVNRMGVIMMGVTQIILNFAIGIALFLFAGIFLVRYVFIWALVILAPFAFACWVLPQTRRFWQMWLNQFVQWSVIGIPLAFFLSLAGNSFSIMTALFKSKIELPGFDVKTVGFFDNVFPYFVILVFLYLGFTLGLQTGAMGGTAAISLTRRFGTWAAIKSGRGLRRAGRQVLSRVTRGREEAWRKWAERQSATRITEALGSRKWGRIASVAGMPFGVTPLVWAVRRGIGEAALRLKETEEREVKEAEKEYEDTNPERKAAAIYNNLLPITRRIAALRQAIEEEQIDDIRKFFSKKGLTNQQIDKLITKLGREALRIHPDVFKKIRDAFPHLAEEMGRGFADEIQKEAKVHPQDALAKNYSGVMERIIAEMKTFRIPKMDSSILFGKNLIPAAKEAAIEFWQGGHWAEAGKAFGREFCDEIRKDFQTRPQDFTPSAQKYFTASPAGRSLYGI